MSSKKIAYIELLRNGQYRFSWITAHVFLMRFRPISGQPVVNNK